MKSANGSTIAARSQFARKGRGAAGSLISNTATMPTPTRARHHRVSVVPAESAGEIERAGARRQHADAIADLRRRGAGALLAILEQLDAERVDDDVLTCREERDHDGDERGTPRVDRGIGLRQCQDRQRQQNLNEHRPASPPPEPRRHQRQRYAIQYRRPQELQIVGETHLSEETDRGKRNAVFLEPDRERRAGERKRQPARKPHRQDRDHPPVAIEAQGVELHRGNYYKSPRPLRREGWEGGTSRRSSLARTRSSLRLDLPPPQGGRGFEECRSLRMNYFPFTSAAICILTILSGLLTLPLSPASPFLIASTASMPAVT